MHVLLHGCYGWGNSGDEAILESVIDTIAKAYPDTSFTVLSKDLFPSYRGPRNVKVVPVQSYSVVKREVSRADCVVFGGGGILHDYAGWKHHKFTESGAKGLYYYGQVVELAEKMGKPVYFYSIGIGPFKSSQAKDYASMLLSKANGITVRDADSYRFLKGHVKNGRFLKTVDPALNLKAISPARARYLLRKEGVPVNKPLIGFSLRPWFFKNNQRQELLKAVGLVGRRLAERENAHLILLPFCRKDLNIMRMLSNYLRPGTYTLIQKPYPPKAMKGICGQLSLMIGMRLHSLILSASRGVPVMGLSYDPKVAHFLQEIKQGQHIYSLNKLKPAQLTQAAVKLLHAPLSWNNKYRNHILKLKREEKQNLRYLFQSKGSPFLRIKRL